MALSAHLQQELCCNGEGARPDSDGITLAILLGEQRSFLPSPTILALSKLGVTSKEAALGLGVSRNAVSAIPVLVLGVSVTNSWPTVADLVLFLSLESSV